jgi:apolipoprotein N-acyltransferase
MAALAGLLLSIANPPADLGAVAFVAMVPLLVVARHARPRRGALLGFGFGLVYYGVLLDWLLRFGLVAWLPLVVSQAAWAALFGGLLPGLWRDDRPALSAVAAAALWTAIEWPRATWPIGGFTWGGIGLTQHANGLTLPLASITGVWGVTFVVVLVNGLVLGAALRWRQGGGAPVGERLVRTGSFVAAALALVVAPAAIPLPAAHGPSLEVAVVQGNVDKAQAQDFTTRALGVADNHIRLNRELASDPPDVAVWPENSLDVDPLDDPVLEQAVTSSIRAVGVPTLVGAVTDAPDGRFYNQVLYFSGSGEILGRYSKMHPVPFGEYVPFRGLFKWVDQLRAVPRDISPGHADTLFEVDGVTIGTPICFENTYPNLVRRFVDDGAELLVVTTNDSSFLLSPASREHVIMSQVRAVENGRWIVQAAISGISAVIDEHGRVVAETKQFVPAILRASVPSSTAKTLYTRLGDWFPWACGFGSLVAVGLAWIRRRRGRTVGPDAPPAGERTGEVRAAVPVSGGADPRVLVVLPTFNERETIGEVLGAVVATRPGIDALVVDDGSPDGTARVVAAMAEDEPRIRLVQRPGKMGLATAYLLGFRRGLDDGYDVLVEMDADLSHRPQDLPALIDATVSHDLVIGSRYVPGGAVTNWSRVRLALSRGGNAYARTLLRLPVADATSGYRAYRRAVLEKLLPGGISSDGYGFQIELAYRAWQEGFTIGEVPITFREREHGRSKLSRRIVFEALFQVARWGVRDRLGRHRPDR